MTIRLTFFSALALSLLLAPNNAGLTAPRDPLLLEARPAREVVPALGKYLGVVLNVDPALADEKFSIRVSRLDLVSAQKALAAASGGIWKVREKQGHPEYWLCPSDERVAAISRYRQEREEQIQQQTKALRESLRHHAADAPLPVERRGIGAFPPAAYDVLKSLPDGIIDQVLSHPNPPFSGSQAAKAPAVTVPVSALSPDGREATTRLLLDLADQMDHAGPPATGKGFRNLAANPDGVKLGFWASSVPRSGGMASLSVSVLAPDGSIATDVVLARTPVPGPSFRPNGNLPTRGSTKAPGIVPIPSLQGGGAKPSLPDEPLDPREQRMVLLPEGRYRHDHLLATLAKSADLETVSDYYTKGTVTTISPGRKPLGELLRGLDRIYRCRHTWVGGCLVFRSENWEALAEVEPRAAVTDQLDQVAKDPKTLTVDDLVFAAENATDEGLATLEYHTEPNGKALPLHLVPRLRMNAPWLRAYGALRDAKSLPVPKGGLYLARLPQPIRRAWEDVLLRAGITSNRGSTLARLRRAPGLAFPDWPSVDRYTLELGNATAPINLWKSAISY